MNPSLKAIVERCEALHDDRRSGAITNIVVELCEVLDEVYNNQDLTNEQCQRIEQLAGLGEEKEK